MLNQRWIVIAGLDPAIHPFCKKAFFEEGWTPGSSPGVTRVDVQRLNQFTRTMLYEVAPAQGPSRSLAYGLLHIPCTKTVNNRHCAQHGKLARSRVVGLGHSLHHVAVLHARKDMQLHIVLS